MQLAKRHTMNNLLKDPELLRNAAFVGGEWIADTPHGKYTLRNPATDELLADLPRFRQDETAHAIEVAHRAFLAWRRTTAKHRSEILRRWYDLMMLHGDDLATLITLEEGKPLAEAKTEIQYAASFLQWFSEEAKRVRGDVIPAPKDTQRIVVLKEPIGVCAAITPWNFPAAMITRKAGPALAAGCSMVVKPASQTPLTALALAELGRRAGVPAGVFNVLTGNDTRDIGHQLTSHPLVRKITFTGSTEVGRVLLAQAAGTIKKCSMELGAMHPSSSSMMRTWTLPRMAWSRRSSATPARRASAPTGCSFRLACTRRSPPSWSSVFGICGWAMAWKLTCSSVL